MVFGYIMAFDRAGWERFFGELSSFLASCDRQEGTCIFILRSLLVVIHADQMHHNMNAFIVSESAMNSFTLPCGDYYYYYYVYNIPGFSYINENYHCIAASTVCH